MTSRAIAYSTHGDNDVVRSAPKAGYGTDAKAEYRRAVWSTFKDAGALTGDGHIVLLPSLEGLEIETALEFGVAPKKLICVDKCQGVISSAKWRETHPEISALAMPARRAALHCEVMLEKPIRAANLDLCCQVNEAAAKELAEFVDGCSFREIVTISVTICRGREDSLVASLLKKVGSTRLFTDERLNSLIYLTGIKEKGDWRIIPHGEGRYVSGRYPMAWGCFTIQKWSSWIDSLSPVYEAADNFAYASRYSVGRVISTAETLAKAIVDFGLGEYFFSPPKDMPEKHRDRFSIIWKSFFTSRLVDRELLFNRVRELTGKAPRNDK